MQLSPTLRSFGYTILAFAIASGALSVSEAFANSQNDITFPVAELGNCTDKNSCKTYCADLAHTKECTAFALKHNLISQEEARRNEAFVLPAGGGPGGCTSHNQCRTYCENTAHIDECVAFAERHSVMPADELAEYKKVARALKGGARLPGGCTDKASCEAFCESGNHMSECLAFAEAAGLMSAEELAEAKRIMPLMKAGKMPGGCRSKEQCEAYCSNSENITVCADFAVEAGFATPQEAEMMKKTGGKGPGGCRGKECETYCQNPANREVCVEFAMEHGLMSEEDMQKMRESVGQIQKMLSETPAEVSACLRGRIGEAAYQKMQSGQAGFMPDMREHMEACFQTAGGMQGQERRSGEMRQMPPEMARCLGERLGSNYEQAEASQFDPAMRDCMEKMKAVMQEQYQQNQSGMPMQPQPDMQRYEVPPHSMPPDGMQYRQHEQYPANMPTSYPPPDGSMPPPEMHYEQPQSEPQEQPQENTESGTSETSSRGGEGLLANIVSIVQKLLGW